MRGQECRYLLWCKGLLHCCWWWKDPNSPLVSLEISGPGLLQISAPGTVKMQAVIRGFPSLQGRGERCCETVKTKEKGEREAKKNTEMEEGDG